MSKYRLIEHSAWIVGLSLLGAYGGARLHGETMARRDAASFAAARRQVADHGATATVDYSLWSESRVRAHEESLSRETSPTLAVLRIPKIGLEVPVLDGTDDLTLNRGVGHIAGTARPGGPGNVGIAGHRDGFFRGLAEVVPGDRIVLDTLVASESYVVDEISIVDPADVEVLGPSDLSTVTLVTCYPFYYVGSAPKRYIVRAVRAE